MRFGCIRGLSQCFAINPDSEVFTFGSLSSDFHGMEIALLSEMFTKYPYGLQSSLAILSPRGIIPAFDRSTKSTRFACSELSSIAGAPLSGNIPTSASDFHRFPRSCGSLLRLFRGASHTAREEYHADQEDRGANVDSDSDLQDLYYPMLLGNGGAAVDRLLEFLPAEFFRAYWISTNIKNWIHGHISHISHAPHNAREQVIHAAFEWESHALALCYLIKPTTLTGTIDPLTALDWDMQLKPQECEPSASYRSGTRTVIGPSFRWVELNHWHLDRFVGRSRWTLGETAWPRRCERGDETHPTIGGPRGGLTKHCLVDFGWQCASRVGSVGRRSSTFNLRVVESTTTAASRVETFWIHWQDFLG
ncbi:hypothetical protein K438DRAFT_1765709 [Mycena galopus ATCC 62051]|nr:hypothetical protein K438DRAFT_1765709 [Mycena galopus ATCC 62051]